MHELKAELNVVGQLDMTTLAYLYTRYLCLPVGYRCHLLVKFTCDTSGRKNRQKTGRTLALV